MPPTRFRLLIDFRILLFLCILWATSSSLSIYAEEPPARPVQLAQPVDPATLVHRALVENRRNLNALRNFIFLSDEIEDRFDKENRVSQTTTRRKEIFFVDGQQVERTLLLNGQTPSDTQRAQQERTIDALLRDAHSSSPRHREERQKKAAKALASEMEMRADIAAGFTFTTLAQQPCGAHTCVRIAAEPKAGLKGTSRIHALLPFLHGALTIDADSGQWTTIDVTPVRKLGAGILYLNEDTAIHLEQQPLSNGPWVLTYADIRLDTRLLWERKNLRLRRTNSSFRRFGAEVRILDADAPAAAPAEENPAPAKH